MSASSSNVPAGSNPLGRLSRGSLLEQKIVLSGVTFDDVLLQPGASNILPSGADTSTVLTAAIRLAIPVVLVMYNGRISLECTSKECGLNNVGCFSTA